MGYSIAIRPKNKKLKDRMIKFMNENFKSPEEVLYNRQPYESEEECYWGPHDDLSYDHGKLALGFNYGCSGDPEGDYMYAALRWMALKIGKKRKWKNMPESVPYMVYDGYEAFPVILHGSIPIKDIPKDKRWAIYTEYGTKMLKYCNKRSQEYHKYRAKFNEECLGIKNCEQKIKSAIKKLDELWNKTTMTEGDK